MSRGLSALALWLVGRLAHRNEPLAGDLLEQFRTGRSIAWLWSQLLYAVAMGSFRQPRVPVALNLTPIDPIVAELRRIGAITFRAEGKMAYYRLADRRWLSLAETALKIVATPAVVRASA